MSKSSIRLVFLCHTRYSRARIVPLFSDVQMRPVALLRHMIEGNSMVIALLIVAVIALCFVALIISLVHIAGSQRTAIQNQVKLAQQGIRVMARVTKIVNKGRYKLFKNSNGTSFLMPDD